MLEFKLMTFILHQSTETQPEIVETIQGEGVHTGVPSFFIRLQGCRVHCFFCDEKETWVNRENNSIEAETDEIIDQLEIMNSLLKRVVITGGEPTEQPVAKLIKALQAKSYEVAIETAGTGEYTQEILDNEDLFVTFSPKEVYSKSSSIQDQRIWSRADELKFVIANQEAEQYLLQQVLPKLKEANNSCPIFLVPDWYNQETTKEQVLELCKQYPGHFRMGFQLHKQLGVY